MHRFDTTCHISTAKGLKARLHYAARRILGRHQRLARVKLAGLLGKHLAHDASHGQADVGVDVDLAHAALDAALNFFHRHAIGLLDVATKLADDGQNVAGGLAGELVGAVAGANGNGQRVYAGLLDKVLGLYAWKELWLLPSSELRK
jgi:hypothetical protein